MVANNREKKPLEADDSAEQEAQKRKRSSLRSIEADLKVIVGQKDAVEGGEDNENGESTYEVFWEYSQTLAAQSGYVDTFLATSLHTNNDSESQKDHNEIVFEDITPSQWKLMMRFINNPLAFEAMEVEEAMTVAPLFDKYEFPNGIKLCDEVLFRKVKFETMWDVYKQEHIDEWVQVLFLACTVNLKKTFHKGREWLRDLFIAALTGCSWQGTFPLNKTQIGLLIPAIVQDGELGAFSDIHQDDEGNPLETCATNDDYIADHLDTGGAEASVDLKSTVIEFFVIDNDNVDMTNPMFPSLLLAKIEALYASKICQWKARQIYARLPDERAWNVYELDTIEGHYSSGSREFIKCPVTKNWQLFDDGHLLSTCENSRFMPIPPARGWEQKLFVRHVAR